jgi:drug/metabolite transporter (DMT)-like permease
VSEAIAGGRGRTFAVLAMLGASALIAGTTLIAKSLGLGICGAALHPMQISAGRFAFALLALVLLLPWLRPSFAGIPWGLQATRSLFGWLGVSCMFAAASRMPLADATAISFLSPLVTMIAAIVFLGDRVGVIRWTAAGISVAGALILIRPGSEAFQPAAAIALAAAFFMGLEAVLIKRLSDSEPPARILLVNNAMGSAIAISAALFVWVPPSLAQIGLMALLGITMLLAQSLFIQAMKGEDASYVIPFFYATLVFATLYDFVLFGDLPDGWGATGAAIILAGSLLLALRDRKAQRSAR